MILSLNQKHIKRQLENGWLIKVEISDKSRYYLYPPSRSYTKRIYRGTFRDMQHLLELKRSRVDVSGVKHQEYGLRT